MGEKRRYFRIQDSIGLALRYAQVQKPTLKLTDKEAMGEEELKSVEAELNSLVNAIWGGDPKIAKSIGLLNRKIEILASRKVSPNKKSPDNFDFRYESLPVSLSASGMSFTSNEALQVNGRLELMLILKPVNNRIVVKGTVVESTEIVNRDEGEHQIRIEFELSAIEEEQLIQYVVQRQVQLIAKD